MNKGYYSHSKSQRTGIVKDIFDLLDKGLKKEGLDKEIGFFGNEDLYIRKAAYLNYGRLAKVQKNKPIIIERLNLLKTHHDYQVRQTAINAAGEIGKSDFDAIIPILEAGLFDNHYCPRNAVIGSIKKMGEVNPAPVLSWAQKWLHHENPEIRRMICHGIELRGRTHPQEVLPLLKTLEWDKKARVRNTLVHVLGQVSYKKGCLERVVEHLKTWENKALVETALQEIISVHERYRNFSFHTAEAARQYIDLHRPYFNFP